MGRDGDSVHLMGRGILPHASGWDGAAVLGPCPRWGWMGEKGLGPEERGRGQLSSGVEAAA